MKIALLLFVTIAFMAIASAAPNKGEKDKKGKGAHEVAHGEKKHGESKGDPQWEKQGKSAGKSAKKANKLGRSASKMGKNAKKAGKSVKGKTAESVKGKTAESAKGKTAEAADKKGKKKEKRSADVVARFEHAVPLEPMHMGSSKVRRSRRSIFNIFAPFMSFLNKI